MRIIEMSLVLGAVTLLSACLEEAPQNDLPLDGVYNLDPAACGDAGSLTRLTIADNQFRFYESRCSIGGTGNNNNGPQTLLDCTGEGEHFFRLVQLRQQSDRLTMIEKDSSLIYHRCTAE